MKIYHPSRSTQYAWLLVGYAMSAWRWRIAFLWIIAVMIFLMYHAMHGNWMWRFVP